jgi:hypothetical protein
MFELGLSQPNGSDFVPLLRVHSARNQSGAPGVFTGQFKVRGPMRDTRPKRFATQKRRASSTGSPVLEARTGRFGGATIIVPANPTCVALAEQIAIVLLTPC